MKRNNVEIVKLGTVVYDTRARNGNWCTHPYENHPKGCPNFPKCPKQFPDFVNIMDKYNWFAVVETFDLKQHAENMKVKHPYMSERQCRNPLYWQGSVRKRLRDKACDAASDFNHFGHSIKNNNIILTIPEACGVNVFETMANVGIVLERRPDIVRKVMLVGLCDGGQTQL